MILVHSKGLFSSLPSRLLPHLFCSRRISTNTVPVYKPDASLVKVHVSRRNTPSTPTTLLEGKRKEKEKHHRQRRVYRGPSAHTEDINFSGEVLLQLCRGKTDC